MHVLVGLPNSSSNISKYFWEAGPGYGHQPIVGQTCQKEHVKIEQKWDPLYLWAQPPDRSTTTFKEEPFEDGDMSALGMSKCSQKLSNNWVNNNYVSNGTVQLSE